MEFMSGLPSEGCGHNSMEIKQEDLPPLELAMDGAPSLQSSVYLDACSLVVSAGSLPVPMPEHLNNAGKDDEINDNQCEEPLTDSKAVQSLEINGKIEIETASNGAPSDQATLQECFIEGNLLSCKHDGLDNTGCTASFCHQEETQMEQATVSLTTCIIEVVDSEKVDIPLVCLPSSENHRACREAELIEDVGESATTDTVIKFNSPSAELGKFDEARAGDQSAVEASDEAHSGDMYSFLSATGSNKSSSDVSCIEEKGSHTCESDSPIILAEAKVICDHDAKPMAVSETVCSVSQGLLSDPIEEIEKEGIVGSTECALDGNGPSEISILNSQDAKDSMGNYATENLEENSSARLQSETKSNADAEESRQPKARDDCNSGDESTLYRNGLPGLNEDLSLEDHLSSGTLVSIVEVTKENIEGDASYDCEDSMSAAPYTSLSSTSSMTSKIRFMEERTSNTQCSIDYTVGADIEGNNLPQTEGGAASSECQHHGCTVDKDGGSSMDSTAGTGPQQSDGCAPVEDEEASSTGGEESASSPASIQPLRQQRKKINIHHQFVREIVKIQHDREQYDREQAGRQVQAQQAASLPQVGRKTSDIKANI
ncbi:hypothetical protein L7F22_047429 [Adiantum nelumboides]|nr:hypothetical protein [Adiantum nelumboides]